MKKMKKILASLMVVVIVLTAAPLTGFIGLNLDFDWIRLDWLNFNAEANAETYSGTCGDNLTWSLDTETGELVISGTGSMKSFIYSSSMPWYNYRSSIKKVTIGNGVTSIGKNAFYSCDSLTSVTIGNGVTSIGGYAFENCTELENVYYSGDIVSWCDIAFSDDCSNPMCYADNFYINGELVTELVIPDSVTSIGKYAFINCSGLTSITIPGSVTSIAGVAFSEYENTILYLEKGSYAETYANSKYIPIPYHYTIDENTEDVISVKLTSKFSFKIDTKSYTMTINCTGNMPSLANEDIPWADYKGYIKHVIINDGCTSISANAFQNFNAIESVTIPDSVTRIENRMFYGCSNLTSVIIPDSVISIGEYAFYHCSDLTSITIPDSVTSIGNSVFKNCTALTSITIPDSVTSIGESVFRNCKALTNITIPDSVTSIGYETFSDCTALTSITIPDSVTSIGYSVFENCTALTSITIPDSVTSIGNSVFKNCTALTSITIPDSVTVFGNYAFENCTALTTATIGNGVTHIGCSAFENCTGLTELTMPISAKIYISKYDSNIDGSFYGCTNIEKITLTKGNGTVQEYTSSTYKYTPWYISRCPDVVIEDGVTGIGGYTFYECIGLKNVTIGNGVTSIGSNAFYGCISLTSVTNGNSVTSIGSGAFYNCENLTNIMIPDGLTSIGEYAFYRCFDLTKIMILDSVTSIGDYAFQHCSGLTNVTIGNSVTSLGSGTFDDCDSLTSITIPDSVTRIGSSAFENCTELENVYYSGDIVSWCDIAFSDYYSNPIYYADNFYINGELVTELVIPDSVTSIGNYAFINCSGLTSITIPDSVTSIGDYTFYGCTGLTSITVPDSVTNIGKDAFSGCTGLVDLTMPISAKIYISKYDYSFDGSFYGCTNIEKITLTKGNGTIQDYTASTKHNDQNTYYQHTPWYISREKCTEIIIENGVTGIGSYTFYGCTNIDTITLPDSVKSIGAYAFSGCKNLEKLKVYNRNCTFGTECISYYTTICGFAGSTAEAYANEMGLDFEPLEDDFSDILKIFIKIVDIIRSIISKPFHRYMFEQM